MSDDFVTVSEVKKIIIKDIKSFWGSDWKVPAVVMFIVFIFSGLCSCGSGTWLEINALIIFSIIFFSIGVFFTVSGIKNDKKKFNRLNQYLELPYNGYTYWYSGENLLVTKDDGTIKIKQKEMTIRIVNEKEGEIEYSYNSINWKKEKGISFIVGKCDNFYVRSGGDDFYLIDHIVNSPQKIILF